MEATRKKSKGMVDAIFCGDIHLRDTAPVCYSDPDEFFGDQDQAMLEIKKLQKKYNCPVYCSGDLFDHWRPSPYLLAKTIELLPDQFHTVIGNHDVPQHNLDLLEKCGTNVLAKAGVLNLLNETHFGRKPTTLINLMGRGLIVWHVMVWNGKEVPYSTFNTETSTAKKLLKKYNAANVILTGNNHQPLVTRIKY